MCCKMWCNFVIAAMQKEEIKSYVIGLTRQMSANKAFSPTAASRDEAHIGQYSYLSFCCVRALRVFALWLN